MHLVEPVRSFALEKGKGVLLCALLAVPCIVVGSYLPVVGGPVFGILLGIAVGFFWRGSRAGCDEGIAFSSKVVLQAAVVLLGFGLDLFAVVKTGAQTLPIIVSTIATALLVGFASQRILGAESKTSTLISIGSSICGGSAIAAAAPVIKAKSDEIAQSISVVFLFNLVAALTFPALGAALGFDVHDGYAFGVFSGTAVNDTSSVTATAATWDSLYGLGAQTLDTAVTVKLTRTLAIIPVTIVLALHFARKDRRENPDAKATVGWVFPRFVLWFAAACAVTTVAMAAGIPAEAFGPLKLASKFLIVVAMVAVGINTDLVKLARSGAKPMAIGLFCWIGVIVSSLAAQSVLGIW